MNYMVRFSVLLLFVCVFTYAQDQNATKEPLFIEDEHGLSSTQIRKHANDLATQPNAQTKWEDLSPIPRDGYDWIQLKHGDWLKGHIRSLYDDQLEFETKKFGIYTFKLKDIKQIKSFDVMRVNIDHVAIFKGIIQYNDPTLTIITGKESYKFHKNMIISIASGKDKERYYWAGDFALNIDIRQGNTDQADYSLKVSLQRRTPKNRFLFDYLGRYSTTNDVKTSEDSRYNAQYDRFLTKKFFITPFFGEYYKNRFQNINYQVTLGSGIGYSIFNNQNNLEWDISAGPAYLATSYEQSINGKDLQEGFSLEAISKFEYKINTYTKIKLNYRFTFTQKDLGRYKHHTVTKIENDIIKDRVFIDISFIWDYTDIPQETQEYTPKKSDFQTLIGAGIKF